MLLRNHEDEEQAAAEGFILVARLRFGQNVQTSGPDRPRIVSRMASEMAIPGRSDGAKRKWLERILKVANISPEAKAAANKAGISRFQSALLQIASASGESEQLQKVEQIVALNADRKAARQAERKARASGSNLIVWHWRRSTKLTNLPVALHAHGLSVAGPCRHPGLARWRLAA